MAKITIITDSFINYDSETGVAYVTKPGSEYINALSPYIDENGALISGYSMNLELSNGMTLPFGNATWSDEKSIAFEESHYYAIFYLHEDIAVELSSEFADNSFSITVETQDVEDDKKLNFRGLTYYTQQIKTWVQNLLASKQDLLESGTNIKTINSNSILGSGDLSIETTTLNTQVATTAGEKTMATFEDDSDRVVLDRAGDILEVAISKDDLQNSIFLTTQKYVDDIADTKADKTDVYTKTETDTKLNDKQNNLVADGSYYVDAEVGEEIIKLATKAYVDSKDPFMLLDFNQTINVNIPYCTENIANTSIPNIDISISEELGANWAIAALAKYEVTNSSNQRINCWPVCSFSMNTQKTLRLRMMCAGTSKQAATKIAGAILLKRR